MLKRCMIADRKDPAFVHHDNPIGIDDSRQAMSHDDGGSSLQQAVERVFNMLFGLGIERAGRFIQQKNGRIFKKGTRNGQTLLLPSR